MRGTGKKKYTQMNCQMGQRGGGSPSDNKLLINFNFRKKIDGDSGGREKQNPPKGRRLNSCKKHKQPLPLAPKDIGGIKKKKSLGGTW